MIHTLNQIAESALCYTAFVIVIAAISAFIALIAACVTVISGERDND